MPNLNFVGSGWKIAYLEFPRRIRDSKKGIVEDKCVASHPRMHVADDRYHQLGLCEHLKNRRSRRICFVPRRVGVRHGVNVVVGRVTVVQFQPLSHHEGDYPGLEETAGLIQAYSCRGRLKFAGAQTHSKKNYHIGKAAFRSFGNIRELQRPRVHLLASRIGGHIDLPWRRRRTIELDDS